MKWAQTHANIIIYGLEYYVTLRPTLCYYLWFVNFSFTVSNILTLFYSQMITYDVDSVVRHKNPPKSCCARCVPAATVDNSRRNLILFVIACDLCSLKLSCNKNWCNKARPSVTRRTQLRPLALHEIYRQRAFGRGLTTFVTIYFLVCLLCKII